jgi:hypothetical protein
MHIKDLIEQLILEELEKLADANINKNSKIAMNCDDFIRLTIPSSEFEATLDEIKARAELAKNRNFKVDENFAPYIKINDNNQVVEHEGRARFYYFTKIQNNGKYATDSFEINIKKGNEFLTSRDELPKIISSQGDGKFRVVKEQDYDYVVYREFDEKTEIKVPEDIWDFQSDIVNSRPEEMADKLADEDYRDEVYIYSADLMSPEFVPNNKHNLVKFLTDFGTTMLFLHKKGSPGRRANLEDPISAWAEYILLNNNLQQNKKLIQEIENEAKKRNIDPDVASAFINAVLAEKGYLKSADTTDDMHDLEDWIRYGDPPDATSPDEEEDE